MVLWIDGVLLKTEFGPAMLCGLHLAGYPDGICGVIVIDIADLLWVDKQRVERTGGEEKERGGRVMRTLISRQEGGPATTISSFEVELKSIKVIQYPAEE